MKKIIELLKKLVSKKNKTNKINKPVKKLIIDGCEFKGSTKLVDNGTHFIKVPI